MRSIVFSLPSLAGVLAALLIAGTAAAQIDCNEGLSPIDTSAGSRMGAMDFIQHVAVNEVSYSKAFLNYTYTLGVSVQTLEGDKVSGEYRQVSRIDYDPAGNRRETVTGGPTNTLTRVQLDPRDVEALRDAFALTPTLLSNRDVVYAGRQQIGDINAAAFDIVPRDGQATGSKFVGRVWVRISENAIIRICGRVGSGPFGGLRYRAIRHPVDDQYWFPEIIAADEDATVPGGKVHVRVLVNYTNYKLR